MSSHYQPPQLQKGGLARPPEPSSGGRQRIERAEIIKSGAAVSSGRQESVMKPALSDFHAAPAATARGQAAPDGAASKGSPTDPDEARQQKDSRFVLSNLTRDALSVNDDEERLIAERVRAAVEELATRAREQAASRGYEEGFARGQQEAARKFQAEGEARLAGIDGLIGELEGLKAAIFQQNEKFLIDLVYRMGRMVLLRELHTDRDYLVRLASELIERMGLRENLRIKIHPSDAAGLEQLRAGILQRLGELRNLNIEASSEAREGGCLLETEWGAIDASLATQLEEVAAALGATPTGQQVDGQAPAGGLRS